MFIQQLLCFIAISTHPLNNELVHFDGFLFMATKIYGEHTT